ncbi:MAG TPA: hypothetical protein VFL27_14935 [Candidatus Dormibacteraeota bacterium]|nr:hypothetical protein [Candidatus Dormibacteraeota bacterium]
MTPAALDLLARLVAEQVAEKACATCGAVLTEARISLRMRDGERVLVEVTCRACDHVALLTAQPRGDEGGVIGLR